MIRAAAAALALLLASPPDAPPPTRTPADAILLTIFLRHDQSRPLGELNAQLEKNGWYQRFPPAGVEVVSWYVVMGIGQVVTLRVPPDRLREVNLAVENGGWGAYRTDFYATYDYKAIWEEQQRKRK
jgi:hypothetical protein